VVVPICLVRMRKAQRGGGNCAPHDSQLPQYEVLVTPRAMCFKGPMTILNICCYACVTPPKAVRLERDGMKGAS
jgi:hypothetical protein